MKRFLLLIVFLFIACEIPTDTNDNSLDIEAANEAGMETPALVFFPDEINVTPGDTFTVSVFALDVENVAGAYINFDYDQDILSFMESKPGTFFSDLQNPIYFVDTLNSGTIEFYTAFLGLGADSTSVSGTGSFMSIVFSASACGVSSLTFSADCELADPDDNPIEIKGFGSGVGNAQ